MNWLKRFLVRFLIRKYKYRTLLHYSAVVTMTNGDEFEIGDYYSYTTKSFESWVDYLLLMNSTIRSNDGGMLYVKSISSIKQTGSVMKNLNYIDNERFGKEFFTKDFIFEQQYEYDKLLKLLDEG